jgi:UDP-glucose 4-epimerase
MHILVTGGAGYIGSHTVLQLLNKNYRVIVIDNLYNSSQESLKRVEQLTGKKIIFYKIDLRDKNKLEEIFKQNKIDAVMHFAGLKAVAESVTKALEYYDNNLVGTVRLLNIMQKYDVKTIIFSSSACVYGDPDNVPIKETAPLRPTNPYGQTKLMIEQILKDLSATNNDWRITSLRYFNPIGAHKSGKIGEDPNGIPNNLLPYISQVAIGKLDKVHIFGNNYPTPDGTGVRDYIHVIDLANAHIAALKKPGEINEYRVFNVGTNSGTSVLEMISTFKKACGKDLPFIIENRRPGDVAECYADCLKINQELGWQANKTIEQACDDAWAWQSKNPSGYH